ncbi:O-acetyl-ADP-ribose deacetylase (regulator of RNase III), contains Macro domain [Prosthecobacter debontii]|uniref:O-acetyl-ADP-ribose deacetylase (Regulator of RNase III), contains Macro domain n=1 Tax=Prosthecobacter debontii TaxID=48467 RepID=A0A1T4X787_9BACT|nr:macro domain-containing protein [Prosthecobacter debontii]SKA85406.1 O-acetyl-ADP-ribose deacetylase (regulator of RNase III), contains Macro domain [Prosthecobacter debontii]
MKAIQYISGDATAPKGGEAKIIVHVCNDIGGWGAGFVLAISKRWLQPEQQYRAWHKAGEWHGIPFELGRVQFVAVQDDLLVANLIGQQGIRRQRHVPPIRYQAVAEGLIAVAQKAKELGASVHMPRIGCGLAGGRWEEIEPLIKRHLADQDVSVTVYDFIAS